MTQSDPDDRKGVTRFRYVQTENQLNVVDLEIYLKKI